ncbi:TPA: hypothetical protein ACXND4_005327, partial [Burkholderia multivorans]
VVGPRLFVPSAAQHEMTHDGYRLLAKSRAVRRSIGRVARCDGAADMLPRWRARRVGRQISAIRCNRVIENAI